MVQGDRGEISITSLSRFGRGAAHQRGEEGAAAVMSSQSQHTNTFTVCQLFSLISTEQLP